MTSFCALILPCLWCFALAADISNHGSFSATEIDKVMLSFNLVKGIPLGTNGLFSDLKHLAGVLAATNGLFSLHFKPKSEVETPELRLMKQELKEIHKALDKETQEELDLMEHLIADATLKASFKKDESAILTAFQELNAFVDELQNMTCNDADDCLKQRNALGSRHLSYFNIKQNMDNIYRQALDNNTSAFKETLIELVNKTYECDIPKIEEFVDGILRLAFKEQQVTNALHMINGSVSSRSTTESVADWMKRMYKLQDYSKKIISQCLKEIRMFMLNDIEPPKYQNGYQTNSDAVDAIRHDLEQKYSWLDWIVMTFDSNRNTAYQTINIDGDLTSFPPVKAGDRNIVATFLDKGTCSAQVQHDIAASLNYTIANSLDDIVFDKPCQNHPKNFVRNPTKALFNEIISELKVRGNWKYIKSLTLLHEEKNFTYAKSDHHDNCFFTRTFAFRDYNNNTLTFRLYTVLQSEEEALFLRSNEERKSLTMCTMPCNGKYGCKDCKNGGHCNHYPYSSHFFCDCKHFFHGGQCEIPSNITMALGLEEMFRHTLAIPKINTIHLGIKDLDSFIGASLGNIKATIDQLDSSVKSAFTQLQVSLPRQFDWYGLVTGYDSHTRILQNFTDLLEVGTTGSGKSLHDLAEAVLGAQRYHGIREWLQGINKFINGTSGYSVTPEEPVLIAFMNHFKAQACSEEYKKAIDNVWKQLMVIQLRGYMTWVKALRILNEPIEPVVKQYVDYTSSQIETIKGKTCELTIPGTENINCSGGFYLNKNINLMVNCRQNYYLSANGNINCEHGSAKCHVCNCSLNGSLSQECHDQTGKCLCKQGHYGDKCENQDCTWSFWGAWSACPCGYANQTRTRRVINPASGSGTCQGISLETRSCFQGCCSGQFHCSRSRKCISGNKHCDNKRDCVYNEDENDCCETRYTQWDDNGNGNTAYLDRHHIDCGSQSMMLTRFKLESTPYPGQRVRYVYECCRMAQSCRERLVNNQATEENSALIYLDKQRVDCGTNSVMNAFRLVLNYHGQWFYQYRCCDFSMATHHSCQTKYSPWSAQKDAKNFFLDRQDVRCDRNSYFSYFHLERDWPGHTSIRYNYRCCE